MSNTIYCKGSLTCIQLTPPYTHMLPKIWEVFQVKACQFEPNRKIATHFILCSLREEGGLVCICVWLCKSIVWQFTVPVLVEALFKANRVCWLQDLAENILAVPKHGNVMHFTASKPLIPHTLLEKWCSSAESYYKTWGNTPLQEAELTKLRCLCVFYKDTPNKH